MRSSLARCVGSQRERASCSGVSNAWKSRHSTASTCCRVVTFNKTHATSNRCSSCHRISSKSPKGDRGGAARHPKPRSAAKAALDRDARVFFL